MMGYEHPNFLDTFTFGWILLGYIVHPLITRSSSSTDTSFVSLYARFHSPTVLSQPEQRPSSRCTFSLSKEKKKDKTSQSQAGVGGGRVLFGILAVRLLQANFIFAPGWLY